MATTKKSTKPQGAIDMGWLSRIEAAEYLGMTYKSFKSIAGRIRSHSMGGRKYYEKNDLLAYLANLQRICKKQSQLTGN